ncbi:MAG TPA: SDR family oxidoreductase [Rhodobacteraceae bacterium]|nr:SDR family oxidoreductase [Paracoccaceae bacterium]
MSKTIVITGASSGIGAATAEAFLKDGWQVGLIARRREALEAVAAGHPAAHVLPADVTDEVVLKAAFDNFVAITGRVDVLFNNAGTFGPAGLIDEISVDEWRQVVDLNLTGMFLAARFAFAQMRRQDPMGGRIINNGSVSAHAPRPGSVGYTSTKHAITGLTKCLSLDGRAFDIACGQIDIGNAQTELLDQLNARALKANPDVPVQPMMDVGIAADAVLQMAQLPLSANVQFMTLMATKMPLIGRG